LCGSPRVPPGAFVDVLRRRTLTVFHLPDAASLGAHTALVLAANGVRPRPAPELPVPPQVRYVVLIVKENRTFDEVFGDLAQGTSGPVAGVPALARFGLHGFVEGGPAQFSLHAVAVTPNHHALARG